MPSKTKLLLISFSAIIAITAIVYLTKKSASSGNSASAATQTEAALPVATATLTLGDKRTVLIDTTEDKILATEGGCEIVIKNGALVYTCNTDSSSAITHKLAVAKGNRLNVVLSDGTHITMNAASKISYPVCFNKRNRRVNITGEAFFDIYNDSEKPFVIIANDAFSGFATSGQFNINANFGPRGVIFSVIRDSLGPIAGYSDEIPADLLKRAYKATAGQFLRAGMNIQILSPTEVKRGSVNESQTLAWLNNRFGFDYLNLPEAMDEIIRWYDIEVEYIDEPPYFDYTELPSRSTPLKQLLKLMESGGGEFRLEKNGKKVVVIGEKPKY